MLARVAARVVCLACLVSGVAHANGERSPMIGGALIASQAEDTEVAGASFEVAGWLGRFGLAVEGSRQWGVVTMGESVTILGASARLLAFDCLVPSLLEPSDVELGFELQAIAQRAWWDGIANAPAPVSLGLGVAMRLRGGSDDYFSRLLLAESRLFVRVFKSRPGEPIDALARGDATMPDARGRELTVVVGLGVLFGTGDARYVERFRSRWPSEL